jgi:MFS transporter, ACS family, glucarate transporter
MAESQLPTRIRYVVLALTVCVAVLLYLDRFVLGYVVPYINEDFRLTSGQTGFLLGAFFLTYAFGQLPGGWLADHYGTRLMLALYLAIWSVLTALMGLAQGFLVLVLFRFGCGLFEAGAYPAAAGLIRRWIPYQQRGLASGVVSIGGRIGGSIAPYMTGFLILAFMPVSSSSTVTPRDLLKPHKLARDVLLQHDDSKKLPDAVQQGAQRLQANLTQENRLFLTALAQARDTVEAEPATIQALAGVVNEWLEQPNLFTGIDLESIKPKLNKQALELLDDPSTPRSVEKTARLNRYLLEVLFPDSIRKILGDGWQPVLMIYGAIGVLIAIVFFAFHRNTPREHFWTNEAEAALAEAHEQATEAGVAPIPAGALWKSILTDVSLWASSIVQFGTNFGWVILGNLLALYLQEVHQVPEGRERGIMASLPFFVSVPVMIFGGWWTDWMTKRYGRRVGRCFPVASTRFVTSAAFLVCYFLNAPWPIVIVLCVMSVVNDLGIPALWGYNLDVGKHNVGLVLGWGNMWGNLGAFVSPIVLLRLRDLFETKKAGYDAIFLTCAGVFVLIGFVSLFIDATKPIGEKAPSEPEA